MALPEPHPVSEMAVQAFSRSIGATPTAAREVNEDDVVSFTPSGASGANIGGQMYAVFRRA